MRTSIAAVAALAGSLLLALPMPGLAQVANALELQNSGDVSTGDYGHPDPCWSLRLQMMRTGDANSRDRFEGCLASYNNSN
jgi:hypothetical protein